MAGWYGSVYPWPYWLSGESDILDGGVSWVGKGFTGGVREREPAC